MMNQNRTYVTQDANFEVHHLPREVHHVYKKYGLWICHWMQGTYERAGEYYHKLPRSFKHYSISHFYEGKGKIWLPPDKEQDLQPGQCVVMFPNMVNKYGATDETFREDFINFTGPIADNLANCGIIKPGVFQFGDARRLISIINLVSDPSLDSQIAANLRLQQLLLDIYLENQKNEETPAFPIDQLLEALKQDIQHWWTVSEMAEFCQCSDSQLRHLFISRVGLHPKQYVDRLKMSSASTMLINSEFTVKKIAQNLGYKDQFHFSRRFKAIVGFSPQAYRNQFGQAKEL